MSLAQDRSPVLRNVGVWDFVAGFLSWRLWAFLGLQDIRQRYRRSAFGPLWLAAGLGVTILGLGLLYSQILKTPAETYVPFLGLGLLIWTFISTVLLESTSLFQAGSGMITTMKVPYTTFVLRCIVRNLIVMAHCIVPVIIAFAFYKRPIGVNIIWAVPGLLLMVANAYWMSLLIAVVCLRFRDVAQIITYTIQIMIFLTPILWLPTQIRANSPALVYNPLYHLVAIVREPIFQNRVPWSEFAYALTLLVVGLLVASCVFIMYRRKLVYWL